MNLKKVVRQILFFFLIGCCVSAQATVLTYFDRPTFLSATGSTNASGLLSPNGGPYTSRTVGAVTVATPRFFFLDYSARLPGDELVISQGAGAIVSDGLDVTLASAASAFGFDFVEPHFDPLVVSPFVDSLFSVTLFNGAISVGSFNFNAPDDQAYFVGASSSLMFNRVQIRELVGTDDNEFYGQFYMNAAFVPEPSVFSIGFFASGALMLARRLRR